MNVDNPVTFTLAMVETPAMFTSSNSDTPSTSSLPLASISLAKVEKPVIFKCLAVISCPITPPPPPVIWIPLTYKSFSM